VHTTVAGFKNEKEVWAAQKPNLVGLWDRYELMTPAGHPDVKGSNNFKISYIENKVGDVPRFSALEESQKEYIDWLLNCGQDVWLCFGGTREKSLIFVQLPPIPICGAFWQVPMPRPTVPAFWKGPSYTSHDGFGYYNYCGKRMLTPR
jgi:hypothetical protein